MINLYAYTYPGAMNKFANEMLVKIGDSTRKAETRMNEQGGAAEYESKITVGVWNNLKNIHRDFAVHEELNSYHHQEGKGTEWFRIPASNIEEARAFIDEAVAKLEGKTVRDAIQLRKLQQRALDQVMAILD